MERTKLIKKIIQTYEIELLTGLHIGGNKENIEIGGLDNPVIRDPLTNQPYIPGSSIKGKMRSLLEVTAGVAEIGGGKNNNKSEETIKINRVFGFAEDNLPSSVIFTDAFLIKNSIEQLQDQVIQDRLDAEYTELKFENVIDRITGKAQPRQNERVPKGAKFTFDIIINVWEYDNNSNNEMEVKDMIDKGISLLESDYLGGNGSRGYGRVKIKKVDEQEKDLQEIWNK